MVLWPDIKGSSIFIHVFSLTIFAKKYKSTVDLQKCKMINISAVLHLHSIQII